MPWNSPQNGIMRSAGIGDYYFSLFETQVCLALNEMSVDFGRIALFKATKFLGKHTVESYNGFVDSDQNESQFKVYLLTI